MAKAKQTAKPWEDAGLTKSTYYRRKKERVLPIDSPVLDRSNKEAIADYRARHASGAAAVETGPKMLTVSQEALAQMAHSLADEAISLHHAQAARLWLDQMLEGKPDHALTQFTGTVRQFRAVRDALLKGGY